MANRYGDHSPNDIENPSVSLATLLRLELESLSPLSSKCSIYRVSERLRLVNENAYTPQVVSIGPLHHGKERLRAMEEHKKRYLCDYLKHTSLGLEYYIKIIKDKEEELRSCYAEPIRFSSDEFTKIVLVDAAFIIEVLLRYCFHELQDEHDRIFNKPWMLQDIWRDVRLLENQLPFFILEHLFNPERISVPSSNDERLSIIKLSHMFFKGLMQLKGTENLERISSPRIEHFVDILRNVYVPLEQKPEVKRLTSMNIPSITELHRAGVKFKMRSSKNLFDIHFSEGILEIPKLTISDEMELTFRNLLAFEECHCRENYLNDYVVIIDRLVNTPKDVDLLVKYGIVENRLGDSSQGATLINKLADGVTLDSDDFYFAQISEQLRAYCKTSWHKWRANLKQNYFHTPWAIVSVIAAVLLIILTIIQAVCSVISVTIKDLPPR
ncbi:hypothetical protein F8388_013331 [Cannabis sativa]|uniref:Uncharacterized protein n=1 Tax=Cannabis sativa TaxID=3483 RepID=A0A7J6FE89_CANSA|nr:hypothetical protein F8388_013331 [Cannabis sativa]KAF4402439.1 hypothetical protein G4B88_012224 [Cannabis sativa]